MKINSFKATNVHGYLRFDLTFFSELTFLIGINGSGKTSALKIILGLTSPSYYYLNQIKFDYCEVVCSTNSEERDIIIKAQVTGKFFIFSLTIDGVQSDSNPIPITNRNDNDGLYDSEEMVAIENRNKELFDNLEIVKKIRDLATPKFLGLDRRIYEGRLIDNRLGYGIKRHQYFHPKLRRRNLEQAQDSPAIDLGLDDIQLLVFEYFRKIAQQQPQISEQFKKRIFKQSFDFIDEFNNEPIPHSVDEVYDRKEKVLLAIQNLGLSYLNYDVNKYFKKIENIVKQNLNFIEQQRVESPDKETMTEEHFKILTQWFNNGGQLKRIDEIINYSQEYQAKISELREPLRRLESIATNFLKEGRKELVIETDGEIHVKLKNGKLANVYELSSGEKQIIIMIAHLIFEEDQKSSGIFIIDEPELSLHIAWQEIFVSSIMEASPKTQFILATHAPSIISKVDREALCQDLNKLNF